MATQGGMHRVRGAVTGALPRAPAWVLALALALTGCVFVPRTVQVYDEDCQIVGRQMVLDVQQIGTLGHCSNEGCAGVLVALGAVASVSAVISGSVVIVGNVVYWFEKRSQCRERPRPR